MAEPIEMPFGILTRVGPRKHMLDGVQIRMQRDNFWGKTCPSYLRTVCSNCLLCRISNFDSSQYSVSMQPVKRSGL